ncbi:hypothetical protein QZH41_018542 [Actinostola sp. cb2023]|nr:hypothetical protein QZH41_018542 [Actinostola sp. cb2023]
MDVAIGNTVLKKLIEMLPSGTKVKQVTVDFEKALWKALKSVLPEVKIQGCAFHWTRAVWRKVQEYGLQTAYSQNDGVYQLIRKVMALPFLPTDQIPLMFARLSIQAQAPALRNLMDYVKRQWVESSMFPPKDWSVYGQPVRTNNDIEGWHNALNRRAGGWCHLPLYSLIELLNREVSLTAINIRLVSEKKLKHVQRKKYRQLQAKLFGRWEQYANGERSAKQLLKLCSHLNGPARGQ